MTNISIALSALSEGQALKITPQGSSMCPFFYGGRDSVNVVVPQFPLKRGQIALYLRKDGTYVIHRVYKVKKQDGRNQYYMLGDNQTWIEGPLEEEQIHAVASSILRKGKLIDCNSNRKYKFLAQLWLVMKPIRPLFIGIWNSGLVRKLKAFK